MYADIVKIRQDAPLVLNITNYVVMNNTANALLAMGASPVMACAVEEMEALVGLSGALVLNIGTLSAPWIEAMLIAGRAANRLNIPVVLDPCGSGATTFRTDTVQKLIRDIHPAVVRGNASEIRSLVQSGSGGKGVDSGHTPDQVLAEARALSLSAGCVVSVSGAIDLIVQGEQVARVAYGHPMMARVTGMGCTASAITGAMLAVNPSPFLAAVHAMGVMGIAGEQAAQLCQGPGSFQMHFLDVLYALQETGAVSGFNM